MKQYFELSDIERRVLSVLVEHENGMTGGEINNNIRLDNDCIEKALNSLIEKGNVLSRPLKNKYGPRAFIYEASVN